MGGGGGGGRERHIGSQRERERERERERQTDRQMDRQRGKEKETKREGDREGQRERKRDMVKSKPTGTTAIKFSDQKCKNLSLALIFQFNNHSASLLSVKRV